jgi:Ca2+-binding RTX toxin-like protein
MKRQLRLQELEGRDVPSAVIFNGSDFQITGSALADTVVVSYDGGAWWTPFDDQIKVSLTNSGETIQASANFWSVGRIVFDGLDGADDFRNNTDVNTSARGGEGDDTLVGGGGRDYLFGEGGRDTLDGMRGDDTLYGGIDNDVLRGGDGSDYLAGEDGADRLFGNWGADLLTGGAGDDSLDGGPDGSADTLWGDGGADTFVQYHRRTWFGSWTNDANLMDVQPGLDTVSHTYIPS